MAVASQKFTSQSLANSANVNASAIDTSGADSVVIFASVDAHALTIQPQLSPLSLVDPTPPSDATGSTGWFNLGSALTLASGASTAYVVNVAGAKSFRVNVANASGGTAVFNLWLQPGRKQKP